MEIATSVSGSLKRRFVGKFMALNRGFRIENRAIQNRAIGRFTH